MKSSKINNEIVVRLEIGDEIITSLKRVATEFDIKAAFFSGIGATDVFTCGVYNLTTRSYKEKEYNGMYEILSLSGNISVMNYSPYIHAHIAVADEECNCIGGHLIKARICATAEIVIHVIDFELNRKRDESIGLNLLDI